MSNIKVGDLVYVAWDCCGRRVGVVACVDAFTRFSRGRCRYCGMTNPQPHEVAVMTDGKRWPLSWLRRIPPLAELEEQRNLRRMPEDVPEDSFA